MTSRKVFSSTIDKNKTVGYLSIAKVVCIFLEVKGDGFYPLDGSAEEIVEGNRVIV
jgi:hypothetical protein